MQLSVASDAKLIWFSVSRPETVFLGKRKMEVRALSNEAGGN